MIYTTDFFSYLIVLFLQAAIVVVFNFLAVIVIFPAMIVIDKNRRKSGKYDLLCCFERLVCVHLNLTDQKLSVQPCTLKNFNDKIKFQGLLRGSSLLSTSGGFCFGIRSVQSEHFYSFALVVVAE